VAEQVSAAPSTAFTPALKESGEPAARCRLPLPTAANSFRHNPPPLGVAEIIRDSQRKCEDSFQGLLKLVADLLPRWMIPVPSRSFKVALKDPMSRVAKADA
jgi:hypothetical protein